MICTARRGLPITLLAVFLAGGIALALPAGVTPAPCTLPPEADRLIRAGLKDLHDGLYSRAEDSFRAAGEAAPSDPAPALFIAFANWWRLIQDRSDRTRDEAFLAAAAEAVEMGGAALETNPGDVRLLTCVGIAHILRSQVEGLRRNLFKAAQEARRGKKSLEAALERDPSTRDALFGLGAYNYYTEKIPGLARGLLFMPRGSAEIGLTQLKTVAASDGYFATDSRLLLALICGSKDERCYDDALRHLEVVLRREPRSPLFLGSIAGVKIRLGYYPEAIRAFEQALAAAAGPGAERQEQRRTLRLYLADALVADWRLDRARATLNEVKGRQSLTPREKQLFERVTVEIAQKSGEAPAGGTAESLAGAPSGSTPPHASPAGRVTAALTALEAGRETEGMSLLSAAAADDPDDPLPHFLMGKAKYERRLFAEAEREMAETRRLAPNPPAWMAGWIELYRGLSLKAMGGAEAAKTHFQAAAEIKRFRSAERGFLELQNGVAPHARCRP